MKGVNLSRGVMYVEDKAIECREATTGVRNRHIRIFAQVQRIWQTCHTWQVVSLERTIINAVRD